MDIFEKYFGKRTYNVNMQTLSLFKDDNENGGFFIKADFMRELQEAAKKHPAFALHTKRLINLMHIKHTFASEPNESVEHGMKVTWCRFNRYGNLKPTLCVPNISGMVELIDAYYHGQVVVNSNFDEVLKQASGVDHQN